VSTDPDQAALACGFQPFDGIIVAWLPKLDTVLEERYNGDLVLYAQDGVVIDVHHEDGKPVRWWEVKIAARAAGLAFIEPFWSGPAADLRVSALPDLPPPERDVGYRRHMRGFSKGPWICIEQESDKHGSQ
jgi:hypothetical protein